MTKLGALHPSALISILLAETATVSPVEPQPVSLPLHLQSHCICLLERYYQSF